MTTIKGIIYKEKTERSGVMKRKTTLPELLSPAGDFEALLAAVAGGADAVYIGGKSFSARAFAKNFELDEIREAVRYCHIHGVKLYVTLNTLIYDKELSAALEYAAELYRIGIDALIIADIGLISLIREHIPDLELHASTQASVHNSSGADELSRLGCKRVVLARELSKENITATTEKCIPEVEVFLHGALCVCHSGQCLFSSLVGGRSGNRGECAQPCRLPYNSGKYPLSLSDLSLAEHIPELIASGVASLKIEGRMKSPDYVYRVTEIYRRLLDEGRCATKAEASELSRIFSRGGFTDGYFKGELFSKMTGIRSEADKESTRAVKELHFTPMRAKISARVKIKSGMRAELALSLGEKEVTVFGDVPTAAISSPIKPDDLKARLSKMGNTYFSLKNEDITVELDEGLNMPPSAINDLRRRAAEELASCDRALPPLEIIPPKRRAPAPKMRTAQFLNAESAKRFILDYADEARCFDKLFVPLFSFDEALARPSESVGVYLPPVITESELDAARKKLAEVKKLGVLYALVGNIGHFSLAKEAELQIFGDFRLNVMNGRSAEAYREIGADYLLSSPELSAPQARDIGAGVVVYGRVPLMITERCFIKENFGCSECTKATLTDRRGFKFPMVREWEHRNLILNSVITYMADKQGELDTFSLNHRHFIFTTESAEECADVMVSYKKKKPPKNPADIRRLGAAKAKDGK